MGICEYKEKLLENILDKTFWMLQHCLMELFLQLMRCLSNTLSWRFFRHGWNSSGKQQTNCGNLSKGGNFGNVKGLSSELDVGKIE